MSIGECNITNRTLYQLDNLDVLRGINSNCIHLIATDPPFNKDRDFHATPDSLAKGGGFTDRWNWERDVHQEWVDAIEDSHPAVNAVINGARVSFGDDMGAYMCWMAVRLIEMHRVLRDDGSMYLHIDHTAHAYVKTLMDAIWGKDNFRNEIVWGYPPKGNGPKLGFHRKHDTILYYGKSDKGYFKRQYTELDDKQKAKFSMTDSAGRKYKDFKGVKTYLDESDGRPVPDWWVDIGVATQSRYETTGYPTQKPVQLYERIIKASSKESDMVLDPFAGCATTMVAAERLGRQWVGIDIWAGAHELVVKRLNDNRQLLIDTAPVVSPPLLVPPERTDYEDDSFELPDLRLRIQHIPERWEKLSKKEMMTILAEAQRNGDTGECICAGCGRSLELEFMHLDHAMPVKDGGANHILNRILICGPCNLKKGANYTISGLVRENKRSKWMKNQQLAELAQSKAREAGNKTRADMRR